VASSAQAAPPGATPLKGGAAVLARIHGESTRVPTATSFRTITVTVMDARRRELKAAGHKLSFTHLIAYAIARAATDEMPVMANHFAEIGGKPHRIDDGAVNLGIAVDVAKKDGSRTLMVPVIRDAGRLSFTEFVDAVREPHRRRARQRAHRRPARRRQHLADEPGGHRHVASVPRLMAGRARIVATGSIAYPVGLARSARRSAPRRSCR